jgi:hypothetical protein
MLTERKMTRPSKKFVRILDSQMNTNSLQPSSLTSNLISYINNSPAPFEEYPLHLKPMSPADAVPANYLTKTSAFIEKEIHQQLHAETQYHFVNIPSEGYALNLGDNGPATGAALNNASFTNAMQNLTNFTEAAIPATVGAADSSTATTRLLEEISPSRAIFMRLRSNVEVWSDTQNAYVPVSKPEQIMAYPVLDIPMYELLKGISPDYIIPNLDKLPENSATVMKVNTRFIESLFVGLNHEMSRELLWREYPTDQRGSYMRMFWDKSDNIESTTDEPVYDIINELHQWSNNLGNNVNSDAAYLVLVVRGKLLEKFPDTLIFAHKAKFEPSLNGAQSQESIKIAPRKLKPNGSVENGDVKFPSFTAKLGTDVTLVGFKMTVNEALGKTPTGQFSTTNAGYFFAMQERPGQLRFGLDVDGTIPAMKNWNNISWPAIGNPSIISTSYTFPLTPSAFIDNLPFNSWGRSSADMAYILTQQPVLFLVHAKDMIL